MTASPQVDFYVLAGVSPSAEGLACRLAMMAWEQGHRVAVRTESDAEALTLDELMWDQPPGRFLPHGIGTDGAESPVSIGSREQEIPTDRGVIINLAATAVPDPGRFTRLLEIVPPDSGQRHASRLKYRQYRDLGLDPAHHTIGKS